MLRDLGQCHFEKIEAAVQIRYGISLAHRFHSGRELNPAARLQPYAAELASLAGSRIAQRVERPLNSVIGYNGPFAYFVAYEDGSARSESAWLRDLELACRTTS